MEQIIVPRDTRFVSKTGQMKPQPLAASEPTNGEITEHPLTTWRGLDYCLVYRGTQHALLDAGIIQEAWIPGTPGNNKYAKTIGRGNERVTVRRISKRRLEVRKFHAPRPTRALKNPSPLPPAVARPALKLVARGDATHSPILVCAPNRMFKDDARPPLSLVPKRRSI